MIATEIILPCDDPSWARAYLTSVNAEGGHVQTCALFAGYFHQGKVLGMLTENNSRPYKGQISEAFSDVIQNAQAFGAWSTDPLELVRPLECGDIAHIGEGGRAHMSNIVAFNGSSHQGTATCVDGGQGDGTAIAEREREWKVVGKKAYLGSREIHGIQRIRLLRENALEAVAHDTERPVQ